MNMYILIGKKVVETDDISEWCINIENTRRILYDSGNHLEVSTVFLGMDHSFGGSIPVLFETLVSGGEYDQYQHRYTSYDDAIKGHKKICDMVGLTQIKRDRKLNDLGI